MKLYYQTGNLIYDLIWDIYAPLWGIGVLFLLSNQILKQKEMIIMVIEFSTDIIFLAVIVFFAIKGMKKGCIASFGGLVSVVCSWLLARSISLPIATYIFINYGIDEKISGILAFLRLGINESLSSMALIKSFGTSGIFDFSHHITNMAANVVNQSALSITSMFTSVLLFSLFMFIFGFIVRKIETVVKDIPLGQTANSIVGIILGAIKGIIIAIIGLCGIYITDTSILNPYVFKDGKWEVTLRL